MKHSKRRAPRATWACVGLTLAGLGWGRSSVVLAPCASAGATQDSQVSGAGEEPEAEEATEIEAAMLELQSALKRLRRSVRDPAAIAASLEQLDIAQAACVRAKAREPLRTESEEESARPAFLAAYRSELIAMLRDLVSLEEAVLAGRSEEAGALVKKIQASEDPQHERFMQDF